MGDPIVTFIERGFDIEPHPVHERQNPGEEIGKYPGRVQPDFESEILHRTHGGGQASLSGRFAPAEDHGFEKISALREKGENIVPAPAAPVEWLEVGVVAIPAPPHASLAKHDRRQVSGVVHGGERHEASDLESG